MRGRTQVPEQWTEALGDVPLGQRSAAHKDELHAQRVSAREAAWQAELEALEEEHRKRVAAAKKLHAAQVRRQKEFLRSIGVPDLSPEEVSERARRWPTTT